MTMLEKIMKALDDNCYEEGERWRACLPKMARAALKAIREPNEAMDDAVDQQYGHGAHEDWPRVWRIMIDAILKEKP